MLVLCGALRSCSAGPKIWAGLNFWGDFGHRPQQERRGSLWKWTGSTTVLSQSLWWFFLWMCLLFLLILRCACTCWTKVHVFSLFAVKERKIKKAEAWVYTVPCLKAQQVFPQIFDYHKNVSVLLSRLSLNECRFYSDLSSENKVKLHFILICCAKLRDYSEWSHLPICSRCSFHVHNEQSHTKPASFYFISISF